MEILTGIDAVKFYYQKKMLSKNIPYIISEIKHFLDEDIKIQYLENINIRNNAEVLISTLNLNNLQSDEILFQLKVYEEKLRSSLMNLTISTGCIVGLEDYGYIYELEKYAKSLDQTSELFYKIKDIIKKNKYIKPEDKYRNIHINTNMNNDLKSDVNFDLTSKNKNNLKIELSKTENTKMGANEEHTSYNISVENIVFYIYIIVFLIVILIFSSSFIGKKIRKLKNLAKEFNKIKVF